MNGLVERITNVDQSIARLMGMVAGLSAKLSDKDGKVSCSCVELCAKSEIEFLAEHRRHVRAMD